MVDEVTVNGLGWQQLISLTKVKIIKSGIARHHVPPGMIQ